jgi:hypothetical protein
VTGSLKAAVKIIGEVLVGLEGAVIFTDGRIVSMVTLDDAEKLVDWLPAASVALAVMVWVASLSGVAAETEAL